MSNEPGKRSPTSARDEDPPYRIYRSGESDRRVPAQRPYTTYRSGPKKLRERLRDPEEPAASDERRGWRGWRGRPITPWRVARWIVGVVVGWLLLSLVLFLVSAQIQSGSVPKSARAALTPGSNMVTGTDTILVIGTDQRPKGSKEPGAFSGGVRSDTIMLWRVGAGTSRRLSIPRDTVASIPGFGQDKINAAWAYGGPALAIKTVEQFAHVKINHLIVVNLAAFPKFINDVGGIDVRTGRICSNISGGVKNGGFSLFLKPGVHHLDGLDALTLARTRDNLCNPASTDLTREAYQQQILNAIKAKLASPGILPSLPWAAWDAPQALRTDMGGFAMLSLFASAEVAGSAPVVVLHPAGSTVLANGGDALVATPGQVRRAVHHLMHG